MAQSRLNLSANLFALTTNGVKAQNISSPIISISTSADFPSYAVVAYLLSFGVVRKAFSVGRNNFGAGKHSCAYCVQVLVVHGSL